MSQQPRLIFQDEYAALKKHPQMPVVRKGFRARKGQTTCKPETDKFILKMRRHWITSGTVF